MSNEGEKKQSNSCAHRESGRACPISKTPCLGECIYADILDDISLGIIGFDIIKKEVFFQNKLAIEIFKGTIKPKDYDALSSLILSDVMISALPMNFQESSVLRYGKKFVGYTIYFISERYFWVYVSDITEKTRLNAIAEAVNTMNNLGYIFSGIRHELGNPINSIKTTLTVCKKNLSNYSQDTVNEFFDRMLSDIGRVEILLRDLKNFSMYENPKCTQVHIGSFMNNLLAMVERDFSANKISIKRNFRPEAEVGIFDPRALQHVLLNILTNASDALQKTENPEIKISTSKIDDRIIIRIRDNGQGIPNDQKKHLFQPFSTTKSHGTGLGLVIVKKMMFKMDGTVEIESEEHAGTIVSLNLPAMLKKNA